MDSIPDALLAELGAGFKFDADSVTNERKRLSALLAAAGIPEDKRLEIAAAAARFAAAGAIEWIAKMLLAAQQQQGRAQ